MKEANVMAHGPRSSASVQRATERHGSRLFLAVAFSALTALASASSAAQAAFPGAAGKLAFVRAGDIWVVDPDGSNPTRLTTHPASDRSPRFSPDGTQIAFASNRDGDFEIFVMPASGGDVARQLTFNEGQQDRLPSWTANGAQIVYDKNFSEIYAVAADGAGVERKVADGFVPATAPHGSKLVFASPTNDGLVTMHLDGSDAQRVTTGWADFSANWSPHGNDLVFTRSAEGGRDVYVAHSDGSDLRRLADTPDRFEFAPVWSPDGESIAFVGCPGPSAAPGCQLYVVGRDGSGETQLTTLEVTGGEGAVDWQPASRPAPDPDIDGPLTYTEEIVAGDLVVTLEERGLSRFAAVDYRLDGMVSVFGFCNGQGVGSLHPVTAGAVGLVPDEGGRVVGSLTLEAPRDALCGCCLASTVRVEYTDLVLTNVASGRVYGLEPIGESYSR